MTLAMLGRETGRERLLRLLGVLAGANIESWEGVCLPCSSCGEIINLGSEFTVTVIEADGSESSEKMSEARERALLTLLGITPPPMLCSRHEGVMELL